MFFSTEVSLPYEDIIDIMRAYPEWKLMMRQGGDVFYYDRAAAGDVHYKQFYERVLANQEGMTYTSIQEGIKLMKNDRVVLHLGEDDIQSAVKDDPEIAGDVYIFAREKPTYRNMVVTNNSPLGPILNFGVRLLVENGVMQHIDGRWLGKVNKGNERNLGGIQIVLSAGQVVLIFIFMVATIGLIFILVFAECSWNQLKSISKTSW